LGTTIREFAELGIGIALLAHPRQWVRDTFEPVVGVKVVALAEIVGAVVAVYLLWRASQWMFPKKPRQPQIQPPPMHAAVVESNAVRSQDPVPSVSE
jgi:hypothetical protein